MALIGNCIYHTSESTGETEEIEITNPDGSVEMIEQPVYNQIETSYEDIYVIITKIDTQHHYMFQEDGSYQKINVVFVDFAGYESQDTRNENPNEPLFSNVTQIVDYDFDQNIYSQGYEAVKLVNGMQDLVND